MNGGRGIAKDCGCGQALWFTLKVGGQVDGDPRMYTQGEISHLQFRGYPARRFVYAQHFKVRGRFPDNVLEVADEMQKTLELLLRRTGCLTSRYKTTNRGGWAS